jgi:hypothetical protein
LSRRSFEQTLATEVYLFQICDDLLLLLVLAPTTVDPLYVREAVVDHRAGCEQQRVISRAAADAGPHAERGSRLI